MKKIAALLLAFVLLFSACSGTPVTTPTPSPTAEPTPVPTPEPTPTPTLAPKYINPLTGLSTEKDISGNRPFAIMINNLEEALPQCGVGHADIIYEIVSEGGITRMVAVYQDVSGAGLIGSVRSTRTYYLDIAQGLDAILLHAGASTYAYEAFKTRDVAHVDGIYGSDNSLFYRNKDRMDAGYEHSLFTSSDRIKEYIGLYNLQLQHKDGYVCNMKFGDSSAASADATAKRLTVEFSYYKTGVFDYSAEDGLYYLSQFGEPYIDGNTNEQVAVKNVLVLYADHSDIPNDALGRIDVDLVGSGTGIYACEGKYVEINWSKDSYDSQFVYTLKDGTELTFSPGRTYINIVDTDRPVTVG